MSYRNSVDFIEEARRQVAELRNKQAENDDMLRKLDNAQEQLRGLTATATSAEGEVTVVAGSGGLVQSVELTESAMSSDAKTLSERINATIRAAIAQATRSQLEIVQTQIGEDIDPVEILGPQAKFAEFSRAPAEETPASIREAAEETEDEEDAFDDILSQSTSTPQARPEEDEPVSESDRFLRDLQ